MDYSSDFVQTISAATEAFASLGRDGAFVNEQEAESDALPHFDFIADWQAYVTTEAQHYMPPDMALIESIQNLLDEAAGEIIQRMFIGARRFRRSD